MKLLQNDKNLRLQTIVTGSHLSPAHGSTVRVIEKDGFRIDARIQDSGCDSASDITLSLAKAIRV